MFQKNEGWDSRDERRKVLLRENPSPASHDPLKTHEVIHADILIVVRGDLVAEKQQLEQAGGWRKIDRNSPRVYLGSH
jgi:hypothetical protein